MPALEFASRIDKAGVRVGRRNKFCVAFHHPLHRLVPVHFDRRGRPHTDILNARLRVRRDRVVSAEVHGTKYRTAALSSSSIHFPLPASSCSRGCRLVQKKIRAAAQ